MDRIPVREVQHHGSAVLRRVRAGETLGITDRGDLIAVVAPPGTIGGTSALLASGRVRVATRSLADLPTPIASPLSTREVLDELRADR